MKVVKKKKTEKKKEKRNDSGSTLEDKERFSCFGSRQRKGPSEGQGSCHFSTGTTLFVPWSVVFRNEITSLSINRRFVRASARFLANGVVTAYEGRWIYVTVRCYPVRVPTATNE